MKKRLKVLLSAVVAFMLVISSISGVFASPSKDKGQEQKQKNQLVKSIKNYFKDMDDNHWASEAIIELVERGIINGYPDKTFKPNEKVTRSEFAKMMTKALDLKSSGNTQTFVDVPPTSWDYQVVEAAKNYLTGYKTSDGKMYFYGTRPAVREDMAVALVKALKLTVEKENGQLKKIFKDYNEISPNLRDYIYTAYKHELMIGSDGKFFPQKNLTRAEAAMLILRTLYKAEKVVVDDEDEDKVVVDDEDKSTDATLKNLAVNGTTISGFAPNVFVYNVVLPTGTRKVPTVTAVANNTGKATLKITQASRLPGTATVVVTAEDGKTKNTYTIHFTVAPAVKSNDATLKSISIDGVEIVGFNAGTLAYNIVLPAGTTKVPAVTAVVNDTGKATLKITQAARLPGTAVIEVTAEDGKTKKTYTVHFTVAPVVKSNDATLKSISIDGVDLTGFDAETLTYNVVLPAGTTQIPEVTAAVNDEGKAVMTITQATTLPGTAKIVVTAEDGETKLTYSINFIVGA
ncbi:MAG TPA: S-layer homology domain-containing protein [Clostridiaceae bacterium]|nr:S-layer homology domain-containing protein [Clostridiaceae bacterium]